MHFAIHALDAVTRFVESGGPILRWILVVTAILWIAILLRLWALYIEAPKSIRRIVVQWQKRLDHSSWNSREIRSALIARVQGDLQRPLQHLKVLVAICPLLGLLGTVTGMIELFDVLAVLGTGNPRSMSSGVSRAILPTMAGMVAALVGMGFLHGLTKRTKSLLGRIESQLSIF